MIRKIKKEVGCSFKENIQYMDQTLPVAHTNLTAVSAWLKVSATAVLLFPPSSDDRATSRSSCWLTSSGTVTLIRGGAGLPLPGKHVPGVLFGCIGEFRRHFYYIIQK